MGDWKIDNKVDFDKVFDHCSIATVEGHSFHVSSPPGANTFNNTVK